MPFGCKLPVLVLVPVLVCCRVRVSAQGTAKADANPQPVTTLRTTTRLVVVDVVVTDKKGHPVHGLPLSSFAVSEDGRAQTIRNVDEHTPGTPLAETRPRPNLDAGTFTNYTVAPADSAINVLLLDALNTPLEDQAFVRQEMKKYLRTAKPGTRMAVFGLNAQLRLLQGFSSDPEVLRAAIEGKKGELKTSVLLDNAPTSRADPYDTSEQDLKDAMGNTPNGDIILMNYSQFQAERVAFQLSLRTRLTLESLNALARYLSSFPGRKNLIWFSGSFPINILPDGSLRFPFAVAESNEAQFRETSNLLSQSRVSVYPIDARGLMGSPMLDTSGGDDTAGSGPQRAIGLAGNQEAMLDQSTSGQATMRLMAEQTGGKAFVNTNGLAAAVQQAVEAGSNYYTLTYSPTNREWKGEYRKIQVALAKQGYTLSYRRGYYADDPESLKGPGAGMHAAYDPIHTAMLLGGPDPTEIIFTAAVKAVDGGPSTEVAPENRAEPKVTGPYRQYAVSFKVDGADVSGGTNPDGSRRVDLGFLTYVYSDKGKLVMTVGDRVTNDMTQARFDAVRQDGVTYRQQISVPVEGEYFLRIGVQDRGANRVGALEVPVSRVEGSERTTPKRSAGTQ